MSLIEGREAAYTALFEGELSLRPDLPQDKATASLAGLLRLHTSRRGPVSRDVQAYLNSVHRTVADVLIEYDEYARSDTASNEALFTIIPEAFDTVADITARTVCFWEKALSRNREPFLLAPTLPEEPHTDEVVRLARCQPPKTLIVETAAAVMHALPAFSKNPLHASAHERKVFARVLASWGPEFICQWMGGTILVQCLTEKGLGEDEIKEWKQMLAPSRLKQLVSQHVEDPLSALDRTRSNLMLMTDTAIAERLGCPVEAVRTEITLAVRTQLAVSNINSPLEALDKVKTNLDSLTDAAIAKALGWSELEAKKRITPSSRRRLAISNINDPFEGLRQYVQGLISHSGKFFGGAKKASEQ